MTTHWVHYSTMLSRDGNVIPPPVKYRDVQRQQFLYDRMVSNRRRSEKTSLAIGVWEVELSKIDFMEFQLRFG